MPVDPQAEAKKEAASKASQANEQFNNGNYCDAVALMKEAIDAYHDPSYSRRLKTYEAGCNMH